MWLGEKITEYGIGKLIYYLALISVNLGLFNLLPFPVLDGGTSSSSGSRRSRDPPSTSASRRSSPARGSFGS
jgi:membrane-associated protease RseP (regulator of RpoE activity)